MWRLFSSSGGSGAASGVNGARAGGDGGSAPSTENVFARDAGLVDTDEGDEWIREALEAPKPSAALGKGTVRAKAAPAKEVPVSAGRTGAFSLAPVPPAAPAPLPPVSSGIQPRVPAGLAGLDVPDLPEATSLPLPSLPAAPAFPAAPRAARFSRTTKLQAAHFAVSGSLSAQPASLGSLQGAPGTSRVSAEKALQDRDKVILTAPGEKTVFDLAGLSGSSDNRLPGNSNYASMSSLGKSDTASSLVTDDMLAIFDNPPSKVVRKEIRPPAMEALLSALEDHDWGMDVAAGLGSPQERGKRRPQSKSEVLRTLQDTLSRDDKVGSARWSPPRSPLRASAVL